jgi:hypothetical protein
MDSELFAQSAPVDSRPLVRSLERTQANLAVRWICSGPIGDLTAKATKTIFFGSPLRRKGFAHRNLAVTWGVLTHNLWVIARLVQAQVKEKKAA